MCRHGIRPLNTPAWPTAPKLVNQIVKCVALSLGAETRGICTTAKLWYPSAGNRNEKNKTKTREMKTKFSPRREKASQGVREPAAAVRAFLLRSLLPSTAEMPPRSPSHLPAPGVPLVVGGGGAREEEEVCSSQSDPDPPPPPAAVSSPLFRDIPAKLRN